jgi:hypothetical protein
VKDDPTEEEIAAEIRRMRGVIEHLTCALENCYRILADLESRYEAPKAFSFHRID